MEYKYSSREKFEEYMMRKYPILFPIPYWIYEDYEYTCECDKGWYPLIDTTLSKLKLVSQMSGILMTITQIKEKYGSLRIYYGFIPSVKPPNQLWIDIIADIINTAEQRSQTTCEVCGTYGELSERKNWVKTLCEDCRKKLGYTLVEDKK